MSACRLIKTTRLTQNIRVQGDGPPLLFLGGSNFDMAIKAPVFESELVRHFTVAAADPRGLGRTEAPDGIWTMRDYAQDALDLMDYLDWQTALVVGESFGAMTALELALLAPARLPRLALAAGAPGGAGGASYPIHTLLQIDDRRERARQALSIQDTRFEQELSSAPAAAEHKISERIQLEDQFLANANNAEGYPRLLQARAMHDCWDRLSAISANTLIIAGSYDMQAPMTRAEAMAARIPNSTLLRFPSGHNVCFATSAPALAIIQHGCQDEQLTR